MFSSPEVCIIFMYMPLMVLEACLVHDLLTGRSLRIDSLQDGMLMVVHRLNIMLMVKVVIQLMECLMIGMVNMLNVMILLASTLLVSWQGVLLLALNDVVWQCVGGQVMAFLDGHVVMHVVVTRMLIDQVMSRGEMAEVLMLVVGVIKTWDGVMNELPVLSMMDAMA